MSKTAAIVQSSYIPWKGYFDLMNRTDVFVLYDDVQYTSRDWRNRNRIKTPQGLHWLTIPVVSRGGRQRAIKDVVVSDTGWARRHWRALVHSYARAPWFDHYRGRFEQLYATCSEPHLSLVNLRFLEVVRDVLGIRSELHFSSEYQLVGARTERLVGICRQIGATHYLSGPRARAYLDESMFAAAGITVEYMSYDGYPDYEQLHPPFEHSVSVLDLIFHTGPDATRFMLSF